MLLAFFFSFFVSPYISVILFFGSLKGHVVTLMLITKTLTLKLVCFLLLLESAILLKLNFATFAELLPQQHEVTQGYCQTSMSGAGW